MSAATIDLTGASSDAPIECDISTGLTLMPGSIMDPGGSMRTESDVPMFDPEQFGRDIVASDYQAPPIIAALRAYPDNRTEVWSETRKVLGPKRFRQLNETFMREGFGEDLVHLWTELQASKDRVGVFEWMNSRAMHSAMGAFNKNPSDKGLQALLLYFRDSPLWEKEIVDQYVENRWFEALTFVAQHPLGNFWNAEYLVELAGKNRGVLRDEFISRGLLKCNKRLGVSLPRKAKRSRG